MKIQKGALIIEIEAAMHPVCTMWRVQGHPCLDREEMAASVMDDGFLDRSKHWLERGLTISCW